MAAFFSSLFFIALAEMGDKTQLIALSFATKYKPLKVVSGIFFATLAVHLLSVIIGERLTVFIPMHVLKILVGVSFVGFGLWTLKGDSCDEDSSRNKPMGKGPVLTVAIAFFLAELGDKTQLATVSLAAQYGSFFGVWFGSTVGMVIADIIAIGIGIIAGKKLPEKGIRFFSAGIFFIFGLLTIFEALKGR